MVILLVLPISSILFLLMMIVPSSITSSPFMVMILAFLNAILPSGASDFVTKLILITVSSVDAKLVFAKGLVVLFMMDLV